MTMKLLLLLLDLPKLQTLTVGYGAMRDCHLLVFKSTSLKCIDNFLMTRFTFVNNNFVRF